MSPGQSRKEPLRTHEVEAVLHRVHQPVAEIQVQFQARMRVGEPDQDRGDAEASEQDRHRHAQPSRDVPAAGFQHRGRILDLGKRPLFAFEDGLPLLREGERSGCAMEQPDPKTSFQARDGPADRRPGEVQPGGRRREAACLDGGDEDRQVRQEITLNH